jgi:hypothetical protein
MLSHQNQTAMNGALFDLYGRVAKPDKAMGDAEAGKKLWETLTFMTGLSPESRSVNAESPVRQPAKAGCDKQRPASLPCFDISI